MTPARPDLNLIPVLQALLDERSVTRAAARVGISQPAASVILRRLRAHFGDELLTRVGNHYELTRLGAQLNRQVGTVVDVGDRLFATKSHFIPAATEREFVLALSDYSLSLLGPRLLDEMGDAAPRARLRFQPTTRTVEDVNSLAVRSVDGMILPAGAAPQRMPNRVLYSDEWVCLFAPESGEPADTAPDLTSLEWVLGYRDAGSAGDLERRLEEAGIGLNQLTVDSFDILPRFVRAGRRLALVQRRLIGTSTPPGHLRVAPPPVPLEPIVETLWWHPAHHDDAGHRWFRELIVRTAAGLPE